MADPIRPMRLARQRTEDHPAVNRQCRASQPHRSPATANRRLSSGTKAEGAALWLSLSDCFLREIDDLVEAPSVQPRNPFSLHETQRAAEAEDRFELPFV